MEPATAPDPTAPTDRYVCLEVFGHRQHYGRLVEVEQFGAKFARLEVSCAKGHPMHAPTYAGAAIFSITDLPGGEAEAKRRTGSFGCPHPECKAATVLALPAFDGGDDAEDDNDDDPDIGASEFLQQLGRCGARSEIGAFCTLRNDHDGDHAELDADENEMARWTK